MFAYGYQGPMNADMPGVRTLPMPQSQMFGHGFGGYQPPQQPAPMNFVQGSINPPRSPYTKAMTQQTTNQTRAGLAQAYNPYHLAKQFQGGGKSMSAATDARIAPQMAQGFAQMAAAGPQQGFMDAAENRQFAHRGRMAQDQEGDALADLMARLQDMHQQSQFSRFAQLLGLTRNFL